MADIPLMTPEEFVKRRIATCQEEVLASLKKHNCVLDATITIGQGLIEPLIKIVALKDAPPEEPAVPAEVTIDHIEKPKEEEKVPMPKPETPVTA